MTSRVTFSITRSGSTTLSGADGSRAVEAVLRDPFGNAGFANLGSATLDTGAPSGSLSISPDPAPEGAFRADDAPGIAVVPAIAGGDKCQRCWKILPEVGTLSDPNLCGRCHDIVHG